MSVLLYLLWMVLGIGLVIIVLFVIGQLLNSVNGQETAASKAVVTTSVPNITPTSPNPNLQYLPQKAYIIPFAPENGIPNSPSILSSLPPGSVPQQVVVPQVQSTNILDQFGGVAGVLAMAGAVGVYVKSHMVGKKADKNEEVTREQSAQIIQSKEVEHAIAKQVYDNMPDKGESIKDNPEIKLETLTKNKEEAVKTATRA